MARRALKPKEEPVEPLEAPDLPIAWAPQHGPQAALLDCPIREILFGGSRGGGKTDGILGKWGVKSAVYGRGFNGVFFRQEMPQADDLIDRAKEIYIPTGAAWQEGKRQFLLPGGGRLRFRPLENVQDASKYQGQNVSDAAVEEAGNYPMPDPIDRLFGCLRSVKGVPPQLILTANPGGAGHGWIKHRFIDPAPLGMVPIRRVLPNGKVHFSVYIPSRLEQNRILLTNDPEYADRLYLVGSATLVKAWLEGDWNVIEGAYFPEFNTRRHVIEPFEIPAWWSRIRAMDWGSAKPFCVLWLAVSDGTIAGIAKGALVVYREMYGWNGHPNVGCKMTASEVGAQIEKIERGAAQPNEEREKLSDEVIDPAAFASDGGPSIAERMGLPWRPADNARVARQGAIGGWDQVRDRLKGEEGEQGLPGLLVFKTCTHLIRTLPVQQHDKHRAEDMDSDGEDHAADALRYGCMSRPILKRNPQPTPQKFEVDLTINELIARARRRRLEQE
jgi:hypothetical protein